MLERWRRRALVAIALYVVALLVWAWRPWTDTQPLAAPEGQPAVAVDYKCRSVFGGGPDEPEASEPVPYPPAGEPCDQQGSLRVLTAVDLALAGLALLALWKAGGRRPVPDDALAPAAPPVPETAPAGAPQG